MVQFLFSLPWSGIFLIILSLVLIGIFLRLSSFYDKINKNGVETDGIVFSVDKRMIGFSSGYSNYYYYEPTIRFLTREEVWVTEASNTNWLLSYFGQYNEGDKVKVKYDPQEPSNFIICQTGMTLFGIYAILIAGFILFGAGVFKII